MLPGPENLKEEKDVGGVLREVLVKLRMDPDLPADRKSQDSCMPGSPGWGHMAGVTDSCIRDDFSI